jgi:uncharacterized protein YgfB (UPF0149 family)
VTAGLPTTPRDYESLRELLLEAGGMPALPELHGGVSGALCAGGPAAAERWLDGLLADNRAANLANLRNSLREVVDATWLTLGGGELGLQALALW